MRRSVYHKTCAQRLNGETSRKRSFESLVGASRKRPFSGRPHCKQFCGTFYAGLNASGHKCTLCTYHLISVLARFVQDGEWEHPNRYSNPHLLHNIAKDGVEFVKVSEDCWEVLEAVDDVNRLRGIVVPKRAVSVEEMDSAIRHRSGKKSS
jgi:hypothetical protein